MAEPPVSSVLFVCGQNSVRSPMARALTDWLCPSAFYTASAGVVAGEQDPFIEAVLAELGIELGRHRPTALEDLDDLSFDLAVTLTPKAHHRMLELTRTQALAVEYWPTPDPTLATGSREQMLFGYRETRDRLAARIRDRFAASGSSAVHTPSVIG